MKYMLFSCSVTLIPVIQDRKVRLNEWDGKDLKEVAVLEGNNGVVSRLAFSPDGKYLASGDVSLAHYQAVCFTSDAFQHSPLVN